MQPARAHVSPRTRWGYRRRVRRGVSGRSFVYNLRLPGQYADVETGLNYNYHRDYDPGTGRYIESDPIGLDGGSYSTYSYANSNPVNGSDPLGLFTSSTHNQVTRAAIAKAGGTSCSTLPQLVAKVDWLPHSQDPSNAFWHAMSDGTTNQTTAQAQGLYNQYVNQQWKSCTCEGLAQTLHAIQDSYARGHAGFQPWTGGLPSLAHAFHDAYPSQQEYNGAVDASANAIRTYETKCKFSCPK